MHERLNDCGSIAAFQARLLRYTVYIRLLDGMDQEILWYEHIVYTTSTPHKVKGRKKEEEEEDITMA